MRPHEASGATSSWPSRALVTIKAHQVVERVVEAGADRVDLLRQVARREAEPLAGLNGGRVSTMRCTLERSRRIHRTGHGQEGLARTGGPRPKVMSWARICCRYCSWRGVRADRSARRVRNTSGPSPPSGRRLRTSEASAPASGVPARRSRPRAGDASARQRLKASCARARLRQGLRRGTAPHADSTLTPPGASMSRRCASGCPQTRAGEGVVGGLWGEKRKGLRAGKCGVGPHCRRLVMQPAQAVQTRVGDKARHGGAFKVLGGARLGQQTRCHLGAEAVGPEPAPGHRPPAAPARRPARTPSPSRPGAGCGRRGQSPPSAQPPAAGQAGVILATAHAALRGPEAARPRQPGCQEP